MVVWLPFWYLDFISFTDVSPAGDKVFLYIFVSYGGVEVRIQLDYFSILISPNLLPVINTWQVSPN